MDVLDDLHSFGRQLSRNQARTGALLILSDLFNSGNARIRRHVLFFPNPED